MSNFTFYKKRNFNAYINDTFSFFKIYAKNFFTNYLIINGAMMLAIGLICTFGLIYLGNFWNSSVSSVFSIFYFFIIILLLFLFFFLLMQCFPIAYLELAEKEPYRKEFSAKEIFNLIQQMLGRMFVFGLLSIFIIYIPFFIIYALVSLIPLLGFFGGMFLGVLITLFSTQAALLFVKDKIGYFEALVKAKDQISERFWEKWGGTAVMNLIVSTFSMIIIIIPVFLIVFAGISGIDWDNIGFGVSALAFVMILFLVIIIAIASNFQTFLQIMIYLGEKEDKRIDEIDLIGQNDDFKTL
ncbi:MAG: hypothetical protein Q3983_06455 [Capnocytophaga sp.]|nr:hypothetical protein [Capnocytophaga sp.]